MRPCDWQVRLAKYNAACYWLILYLALEYKLEGDGRVALFR